jgi:hypothetical protein
MEAEKLVPVANYEDLVKGAVEKALEDGYDLSGYDNSSLKSLDKLLLKMHGELKHVKKQPNSLMLIDGVCSYFSAYIVKHIRENLGVSGNWYYNHKKFGDNTFPFVISKDLTIFPFGWVRKRIIDGKKESIEKKYTSFSKLLS